MLRFNNIIENHCKRHGKIITADYGIQDYKYILSRQSRNKNYGMPSNSYSTNFNYYVYYL